jgi:ArsR family transcriptional regulator
MDKSSRRNACCSAEDGSCVPLYPGLGEVAKLFRALADETRLAMLKQLREQGEVNACDFVACCTVAQPTVSHHLKVLRRAGLVKARKRGVWVAYTLNEDKLEALRKLIP